MTTRTSRARVIATRSHSASPTTTAFTAGTARSGTSSSRGATRRRTRTTSSGTFRCAPWPTVGCSVASAPSRTTRRRPRENRRWQQRRRGARTRGARALRPPQEGHGSQRRPAHAAASSSQPNTDSRQDGPDTRTRGQLGPLHRSAPAHPRRHERRRRRPRAPTEFRNVRVRNARDGLEGLAPLHGADRVRAGDRGGERPVAARSTHYDAQPREGATGVREGAFPPRARPLTETTLSPEEADGGRDRRNRHGVPPQAGEGARPRTSRR